MSDSYFITACTYRPLYRLVPFTRERAPLAALARQWQQPPSHLRLQAMAAHDGG